jgi:hypothetical protein
MNHYNWHTILVQLLIVKFLLENDNKMCFHVLSIRASPTDALKPVF